MKNVREIIKEAGVELTEEQLDAINAGVVENYRTIAEVKQKEEKISAQKSQIDELSKKIGTLEGTSEELEQLKKQVADYQHAEEQRTREAEELARRKDFEERFNAALEGKTFANDLIREAVFTKAYESCKAQAGKPVTDAIKEAAGDMPGVWSNPQQDPAKMPSGDDLTRGKTEEQQKISFLDALFN